MDERDEKIDRLSAENIALHEELSQARATMAAMADELEDSVTLMKAAVERAEKGEQQAESLSSVLRKAFLYCGNVAALPPQQAAVEIDKFMTHLLWPTSTSGGETITLALLKTHFQDNREMYKTHIHLLLGGVRGTYAISREALQHIPAPQLAQYIHQSIAPTIAAKFAKEVKHRYGNDTSAGG